VAVLALIALLPSRHRTRRNGRRHSRNRDGELTYVVLVEG
jgi:hypothetical protein